MKLLLSSKHREALSILTGTIGQFDFVANFKLPLLNSPTKPSLLLVPSGNKPIEYPFLVFSTHSFMLFIASLGFSRSSAIPPLLLSQYPIIGTFRISFFAINPTFLLEVYKINGMSNILE